MHKDTPGPDLFPTGRKRCGAAERKSLIRGGDSLLGWRPVRHAPKEDQLHGYTVTRKYFSEHAFVAESLDEDISGDKEPLTLREALGR